MSPAIDALTAATLEVPEDVQAGPARFALVLHAVQDPVAVAAAITAVTMPLGGRVTQLSALDLRALVLELPGRVFGLDETAAFAAAYVLAEGFALEAAEPDLPTALFPDGTPVREGQESVSDLMPWCWAPEVPALNTNPLWALRTMRVPEAWAFSEEHQRPSRGEGVVIAQPDTGITKHPELADVLAVPGYDMLSGDADPTDPLNYFGNKGHGTGTASVVVSPETLTVTGSAPRARHMAIRAIETVYRVQQVSVAQAIDWAVEHGAQVITMSLGGIFSIALERALRRAVEADVIVLAAAGNCVKWVVWPARFDDCIAVAGTNIDDMPWRGTCRGPAVDISAPGENVIRAALTGDHPSGFGQGQGTSFAVALTAGVAALWLAHHGRANLVAAARARGETLQVMFRRLVRATARRPDGWDIFEMGAGVVDARALLAADLDLGRDRETVERPADRRERAEVTVKSLVAESSGYKATLDEAVDWYHLGPEITSVLLRRQVLALHPPLPPGNQRPEAAALRAVSPVPTSRLASAAGQPALRAGLGLGPLPEPEVGL